MSATVASRCMSTKCVVSLCGSSEGTNQRTAPGVWSRSSSTSGGLLGLCASRRSTSASLTAFCLPSPRPPPVGNERSSRSGGCYICSIPLPGGNECSESFVVAKHPARLTVEVHRGVPPATDQQGIGFIRFRRPERGAVESTERNRGESVVAARARYDTARVQWDATNLCTLDPLGSDDQSRVDDCANVNACIVEVKGGTVRAVIGGEDGDAIADPHSKPVEEGACGTGEENSRSVVVGEDNGGVVSAGSHDGADGSNAPDPLAEAIWGSIAASVIGTTLHGKCEAVIV